MVVQDQINAALRKLGVLEETETPTASNSNNALFALNQIVDEWQGDRGKIPSVVNTVGTLTPGKQTYTVGPGGDINIPRPTVIDHVNYINTVVSPNPIELPVTMLTSDAWAAVTIKPLQSPLPSYCYYDYGFSATGTANLSFWMIPNISGLQYSLYVPTPFATFATLQSSVLLPPGYWRMLVNWLAIEIAPEFGVAPSQDVKDARKEAEEIVLRNNTKQLDMQMDPGALVQGAGSIYRYNIYSDGSS